MTYTQQIKDYNVWLHDYAIGSDGRLLYDGSTCVDRRHTY